MLPAPQNPVSMPLTDFKKKLKRSGFIRKIEGDGLTLHLIDTGTGLAWAVARPDASDTVSIAEAKSFERLVREAADAGVREAVRINGLIATDRQNLIVAGKFPPRGRVYVLHAPDVVGPHEIQPEAAQ